MKLEPFDRITINPGVMGGRPCVRGMRITVGLVVNLLANGMSQSEIVSEYPDLDEADILQCLKYAACLAEHREVEIAIPG